MGSPENEGHFNSKHDLDSPFMDDRQGIDLLRSARSAIEHNLRGLPPESRTTNPSVPLRTSIFVTLWGQDINQTSEL